MGKLSRTKGASFERLMAQRFTAIGCHAKRNLEEVRSGNCGDLVFDRSPLAIQCKIGAAPNVWKAVAEAEEAAKPGHYAVAITKRNRANGRGPQEIASLPLDDFMELVAALRACGAWP